MATVYGYGRKTSVTRNVIAIVIGSWLTFEVGINENVDTIEAIEDKDDAQNVDEISFARLVFVIVTVKEDS